MKKSISFILAILFIGCDLTVPGPAEKSIKAPFYGLEILQAVGDSVEVVAGGADVYDRPNGAVVDFAPAGSRGLVTREKDSAGVSWAEVDFEESFAGDIVLASRLQVIGSEPPPDPPPGGGSIDHVLIFGCSNASNLADGVNEFSQVMTSTGGSPGNRGKTIISYGEASSGSSGVFDHVRSQLTPAVDAVIVLLCHRYDYTGENRPGARNEDTPELLPAGASGSTLYGELDLIRRTAINTRDALDGAGYASTPLYLLALHDYEPAGSCARVGEYIPTMLRSGIEIAVSEGLASEMTYNGAPFKLLELIQPDDTTSEGCHIAAPGQSKLIQGNPDGGLDDWAAEN